ncbi:MAG TPA: energy transducer TonB [Burkholderiaceae bacterium]|nr:energy transducer TonB [Burkholderiaceae bacterium]
MTTMTFENIYASPRRVAARRIKRVTSSIAIASNQPLVTIAKSGTDGVRARNHLGLLLAIGGVVALHAVIIAFVNQPMQIAPMPRKMPDLVLEIAPPPPPPLIQPTPLPQVAAVKPVARTPPPPPSVPVVQSVAEVSTPSADSVQVAAAPPASPAPVVAAPEPISEPRGYAGYLNNPAPNYPSAAQKRGLQGRVILKIHVLASGQPDNVSVAKSSGYDILDDAAVKAVTAWMFDPAKRGQTPIDGWVNVPINFKLS